ncbi:C-type lectin domain family 3 member A [Echinops telfairi]|uniref:C-type lectin domain family 3 member A n=1 Tax=Echinops telfairi TaxID=9371 RepID=A0ABM0IPL0_ECHTE|nr:C-type lectin domain family 3 member A [Echinops telfairi]
MAKWGLVICILVITLFLDQTTSHPSKLKGRKHSKRRVKVCLRGTKVHKKCYLASEVSKHFHEANEDCISKGGTLVIPRNSDETNALRDYGKQSLPGVNDFWVGINDMVTEGKFVDVHGAAISFLNWDRAQPSGGKRENCVLFSQSAQGKWSDEVCRSSKRYICEFTIP